MSKKGLVITIITILIILVSAFLGIKYTQEDIDKISNIVENVIEDISYDANENSGKKVIVTKELVEEKLEKIVDSIDTTRYIL